MSRGIVVYAGPDVLVAASLATQAAKKDRRTLRYRARDQLR